MKNLYIEDLLNKVQQDALQTSDAMTERVVKKEQRQQKRTLNEIQYKLKSEYKKAGIPKRYQDASFDTMDTYDESLENIVKYLTSYSNLLLDNKPVSSFVLLGFPGNGKTHLAVAFLKYLIKKSLKSEINTPVTTNLITLHQILMENKDFDNKENFKSYERCSMLVIDEFNQSINKMSEYDKNTLFDLINYRYNECLPTFILSNFNREQFLSAIGEQIQSRLFEDGQIIFTLGLDNYRLKRNN